METTTCQLRIQSMRLVCLGEGELDGPVCLVAQHVALSDGAWVNAAWTMGGFLANLPNAAS